MTLDRRSLGKQVSVHCVEDLLASIQRSYTHAASGARCILFRIWQAEKYAVHDFLRSYPYPQRSYIPCRFESIGAAACMKPSGARCEIVSSIWGFLEIGQFLLLIPIRLGGATIMKLLAGAEVAPLGILHVSRLLHIGCICIWCVHVTLTSRAHESLRNARMYLSTRNIFVASTHQTIIQGLLN